MNALQRASLTVTKAQIVIAKSQPKETATLFPIGADEIKALGHSSYIAACQSLIITTCCDSKTNVSWRDTQANSEGVKFAWTKLFISTVLFLLLLQPLVVPSPVSLHRVHSLLWAVDGSRGPSGQSNDIQTWKKFVLSCLLCFLWNLNWPHSHYSFAWTTLCKIFAEFWALWSLHIFCHRTALTLARWRCKPGLTECSSATFSP